MTDPPRVVTSPPRFLSPEEARDLLEAAKGERPEALYVVTLLLGLRIGEALGLRWEDVDLDAGRLEVRYALQRVDGKPQLREPKTKASRRSFKLAEPVAHALQAHKARQLEDKVQVRPIWQETGLVFTSTIGSPLDPSDVSRGFQELLRRKGLPRLPLPRLAPHLRRPLDRSRYLAEGRPKVPRPQPDRDNDERLRPCPAKAQRRRCRRCRWRD